MAGCAWTGTVDYPLAGSVFPPEFPAPAFLWRDNAPGAKVWRIEIGFAAGGTALTAWSAGERLPVGAIDPRCVAEVNRPPEAPPGHAWRPPAALWLEIQRRSRNNPATVTISGFASREAKTSLSRAETQFTTSTDSVDAPIFYRDVPLMPSELEKGVIKPLATGSVPLIAWRLRDVRAKESRVVMEGIHSCANCHSFSRDGKTLGIDIDGPLNDKGLYALVPVAKQMTIGKPQLIEWSTFRGKLGGKLRVGFMSQVSPDGRYVVTMINDTAAEQTSYQRRQNPLDLIANFFVANFKDYRFLQVFYPTRGVLAWYSRETGVLQPLPGADDPRYVHTNAVWSPDGQYLVFARAEARDAYPPGARNAAFANDLAERSIQYDLYRVPFNGGRGGTPEPIRGASANGMSNSFPKVSPDGKWIVYVEAKNGQLMRPDSQLHMVPAEGGLSRRMSCNTRLMNSWHSFSPNGRWMVFSSKSRSPYTQMFLTHIDADGKDTPAILIENSTAANRAVNLPEFVNIAPDGMQRIEAPVTEYFSQFDRATDISKRGASDAAIAAWQKAVSLAPEEAAAHFNLANALAAAKRRDEAMEQYQRALALSPDHSEAHNNLGKLLLTAGRAPEALSHFEQAVAANPRNAQARTNLGVLLAQSGRVPEAIEQLRRAIALAPDDVDAHNNLGLFLAMSGDLDAAIPEVETAARLSQNRDPLILDLLQKLRVARQSQPRQ